MEQLGHGKGEGTQISQSDQDDSLPEADLAWHVRAWGQWVLARARKELASYYPTYAEYQPLTPTGEEEQRPLRLLDLDENGVAQLDPLNAEFNDAYLKDPDNPRWVAKPTVAYLWARTVTCKQCRATLPLLKTRWLCKKENKRVLLTMEPGPEGSGLVFGVQPDVPQNGGNGAQRREHDKRIGAGTMSRTGAQCPNPSCGVMTMSDIRMEGQAGRLGAVMTAVVVDGVKGKEYRLPTGHEIEAAQVSDERLQALYADIPFGLPEEPTPKAGSGASRAFSVDGYGFDTWRKLFTNRQSLALGEFVSALRKMPDELTGYPEEWREALAAYLVLTNDRMADYSSAVCSWHNGREIIRDTFARFALPIVWDYTEVSPMSGSTGNYLGAIDWVSRFISHALESAQSEETPSIESTSATGVSGNYDAIITDPPYYDAIPYSDCMDFFHVWLRRTTHGVSHEMDNAFQSPLGPKWNHDTGDGELIDDASRFGGDKELSKQSYEDGMARAFQACHAALRSDGRLVVVFANKQPDAWETLVGALIRAGFVVDGSWPIQTEMGNRNRAIGSAALASSVWLVCRKRPAGTARLGQQCP